MAGGALEKLRRRAEGVQVSEGIEVMIPVNKLKFDPNQPRKRFHTIDGNLSKEDQEIIEEMAGSIQEQGQLQSIAVQEESDGSYKVIYGECRARAHLLLGKPTIRAIIRNDLDNAAKRLKAQISENVNRTELTEKELADAIRWLLDYGDEGKPMKQVEIARAFGWVKRQDKVTHYLRFGDEEVQRVWVQSGITPSPFLAYLASNLSVPSQMDILRRTSLSEDDPDYLAKPVSRKLLDDYRDQERQKKSPESVGSSAPAEEKSSVRKEVGQESPRLEDEDIAGALSEVGAGGAGFRGGEDGEFDGEESSPSLPGSGEKYSLPEDMRAKIVQEAGVGDLGAAGGGSDAAPVILPVQCRATVANLVSLLEVIGEDKALLDTLRGMRCEFIIPGGVAREVAARLSGVIVDDREVAATVQNRLVKL